MAEEKFNTNSIVEGIPDNFEEIVKSYERKIVNLEENNKALFEQVVELQSEQKHNEEYLNDLSQYADELSRMINRPGCLSGILKSLQNKVSRKKPPTDPVSVDEVDNGNNNKAN